MKNKNVEYYVNLHYQIIVSSDNEGGFLARYKEFENIAVLFGMGKNESEAISDLKSALPSLIEALLAQNAFIPEPKSNKSKNLAVTMKQGLLDEIDFYANQMGLSRSAFLAVSAKHYIQSL